MPVVENSEKPANDWKVVGTRRVPGPADGVCGLQ